MNDKLKFRVWSLDEKRFLDGNFFINQNGVAYDDKMKPLKNCIIQKSTGRFDKNGYMIYAGDVLWDDWEKDFMRVYWDNGGYSVGVKGVVRYDLSELSSYDIEVRGNVFEGWTSPYQDVPVRNGFTRYENRNGVIDEKS
jgi:hypothetical protein